MDTNELRAKVYKKFRSQAEFSRYIGWSSNKISRILTGEIVPDINDCAKIAATLSLTPEDYRKIFLPSFSPFGDVGSF